MNDFETFTRDKISRLRAEADALEKILKEFQGVRARAEAPPRRSGDSGGAFGAILESLETAGASGLSIDQMIKAAAERGFEVKRNTLRSQLWQAKQEEKVEQISAGLYRIPGLLPGVIAPQTVEQAARDFAETLAQGRGPRESFSADLDDEIPF